MKIAVYGDSFACGDVRTSHFHWYNLLADKLSAKATSFGLGATSLYYSFKLFEKHHKDYDLNIVCVSHFQRFPFSLKLDGKLEWPNSISAVDNIKNRYKDTISKEDLNSLNDIYSWYRLSKDEYLMDVQESFLKNMESECSNLVLLPSFNYNGSFGQARIKKSNIGERGSMLDFSNAQNNFWKDKNLKDAWQENVLKMACHFTPETNCVVADVVYNYIFNKQQFDSPEIIPQNNDRDYYYNKL